MLHDSGHFSEPIELNTKMSEFRWYEKQRKQKFKLLYEAEGRLLGWDSRDLPPTSVSCIPLSRYFGFYLLEVILKLL